MRWDWKMANDDMDAAALRVRELLDQRGIKWHDAAAYGRSYRITLWKNEKTGHVYEVTRRLGVLFSNQVELTVHGGSTSQKLCVLPEEAVRIATDERFAAACGVL